jgi:hypothetical protein
VKLIPLTQGLHAKVDDEDYPRLRRYTWHALGQGDRTEGAMVHYYACRWQPGKRGARTLIRMHQAILGLAGTKVIVDHIDGDTLNNQKTNLRPASTRQNLQNRFKQGGTSSKYKGVCFDKGAKKWRAYIVVADMRVHLGFFVDELEAAKAYDHAARRAFKAFAKLNFPDELHAPTDP